MSKRTSFKSPRTGLLAGLLIVAALAYARPGDVEGDVWVFPPAHRNMQAFRLGDVSSSTPITIPEGSRLKINVRGSWAQPYLTVNGLETPLLSDEEGYSLDLTPDAPHEVALRAGLFFNRAWSLDVVNDESPTIQFTATPSATPQNFLRLPFEVSDDVGVTSIQLEFNPIKDNSAPIEKYVFSGEVTNGEVVRTSQYLDLLRHPMAGQVVMGRLVALDALGQRATSATMRFKLPALRFNHGPAMTLSSVRQRLLNTPDAPEIGIIMLGQLGNKLEDEGTSATLYSLVQSAYFRLKWAQNEKDVRGVAEYLWDVALYAKGDDANLTARNAIHAINDMDALLRAPVDGAKIPAAYRALLNFVRNLGDVGSQASAEGDALNPDHLNALRLMDQIAAEIDSGHHIDARHSLSRLIPYIEALGQ